MNAIAEHTPALQSRLPQVGTTIFTVMSALAAEKGAVNLGQGFPDFGCDRALTGAVTEAMNADLNQYPPMAGVPQLRQLGSGPPGLAQGSRPARQGSTADG